MKINIIDIVLENEDFREVIKTGTDSQLAMMTIPSGQDIGDEVYADVDQITYIVQGVGELEMQGEPAQEVRESQLIFVSAGQSHNITNTGNEDLKLFTIYAPPEYPLDTIHETKSDALQAQGIEEMEESDMYSDELLEENY